MKFAEHLGAHITPEWRKQYIQYEALKDLIYEASEQSPSTEVADASTLQRYYARFDERFFQFCDKELSKINTFFYEKISEANRKFASLRAELDAFLEHAHKPHHGLRRRKSNAVYSLFKDKENRETAQIHTRKLHDLKLAFSEFYLSLILLQNYQSLNFTGFRKILKKHDKIMVTTRGVEWRQQNVETAPFYTNKEVDHLIKETEQSVTSDLEGGNRSKAMKRLRVPPLGEKQNPMTMCRVGLFFGMFIVLVIVVVITAFFTSHSGNWEPALRMFRGMFLIIMMICFLGINTYGWRSSGVNHVLIFEIDPRRHLSPHQLLELAAALAVVWTLCLLGYLFSNHLGWPPFIFPLIMAGFLFLFLINPIRIFHHSSRYWLLSVLFRIVTSPFHHVGFADFWLADQLNSLAIVLLDFEYMKMDMQIPEMQDCKIKFQKVGSKKIVQSRRFVWNFFRLENEHLNNCGQFRAVRDISIAPIDSNDQNQLEEMMDDEEGDYPRTSERRRLLGAKSNKKEKGWIDEDEQTKLKSLPMKFKGV
ncbi:Hypothetical predicted protein [Mytilus galloprovincialis]|uniref:Xenotropic and polytropic retrovirus receptor 1 n=1 Tax=Mytilus galloprovincialis TaxID=29158 RepID=A0A8B6C1V6_MYTGA|nr:Hypothetical predicted protein [Mytilus galloprovincialis]